MFKYASFYDAQYGPKFAGLASAPDPVAQPDGTFNQVQNFRVDDNILRIRQGHYEAHASTPASNLVFIGGRSYKFGDDKINVYGVFHDTSSDKVRVFFNQHTLSSGTFGGWTECTASSGKYGDTRLSPPWTGWAGICSAPSSTGALGALVMTGKEGEYALHCPFGVSGGAVLCRPVDPPSLIQMDVPVAGVSNPLVLTSSPTITNSGGGSPWTTAWSGSVLTFQSAAGVAAAQTSSIVFATGKDWSGASQALFLFKCDADSNIWANLKVEIGTGGTPTYYTILDHSTGLQEFAVTDQANDGGLRICAIPLGNISASVLASINSFRITAINAIPSGTSIAVVMAAGGGQVPGGASYAQSFRNSSSRVESPALVMASSLIPGAGNQDILSRALADSGTTEQITMRGDRGIASTLGSYNGYPVELPVDPRVNYLVTIPIQSPSSTQGGYGVDYLTIWRRDPGESEYTYVTDVQTSEYSGGSWTYFSPFSGWSQRKTTTDTIPAQDKDFTRQMPDGGNVPPPAGTCGMYANGKLHIGAPRGTGSYRESGAVWISDQDQPFRFNEAARFTGNQVDERFGIVVPIDDAPVIAMEDAGTVQKSAVFAATQNGVFIVDFYTGGQRISAEGTLSPGAFIEKDGTVVWLSVRRNVMAYGPGGIQNLSQFRVNDVLEAIPDAYASKAAGAVFGDRILIGVTPSGGTSNTKVLVYNMRLGLWESLDDIPSSMPVGGWFDVRGAGAGKLYYTAKAGKVYQWEKPGQATDNGTAISPILATRSFMAPDGKITCRRGKVIGDGGSGTLSISRVFTKESATVTGVIALDATYTDKVDKDSVTNEPKGGRGVIVYWKLSGTAPAGWTLRRFAGEMSGIASDGSSS